MSEQQIPLRFINQMADNENDTEEYGSSNHEIMEAFLDDVCPQIRNSKLLFTRLAWIVAYCCGIVIFSYQMTPLIQKYQSFQTQTSVILTTANVLDFPSLTVCNPIFLKRSEIESVSSYSQLGRIDQIREFEIMKSLQPQNTCLMTQYKMIKCEETSECVPDFMFCDGIPDCSNSFDEKNELCEKVTNNTCGYNSHSCNNSEYTECVNENRICDGNEDCSNGMDEVASLWDNEACKKMVTSTCTQTLSISAESRRYVKELQIPVDDNGVYSVNMNCEWLFQVDKDSVSILRIHFANISIAKQSTLTVLDSNGMTLLAINEESENSITYIFDTISDFKIIFESGPYFVDYGAYITVVAPNDKRKRRSSETMVDDDEEVYGGEYHERELLKGKNLKVGDWRTALGLSQLPDNSDILQISMFSKSDLIHYGVQKEDFIVYCSYDGTSCSSKNFKFTPSKASGSCFTFNSAVKNNGERARTRKTVRTGNRYGLKLTLFLEKEESIGILQQSDAALLSISESHRPYIDGNSVTVMPGYVTHVGLRQQVITRAEEPYSNCSSSYPHFEIIPAYIAEQNYLYDACLDICIQNQLWQSCHCVDNYYFDASYRLCSMWDDEDNTCRIKLYKLFSNGKLNCSQLCTPACNDVVYDIKVTYSPWPSSSYVPHLLKSIMYSIDSDSSLGKTMMSMRNLVETNNTFQREEIAEVFRKNLARVEIHYEMLNYEHIKEAPAYQLFDLVADFGGNLGLWIGWSALVLMDIAEMIIELIWFRIIKKPAKRYHSKTGDIVTST